jgi:hypothetical protein
MIPRSGYRLSEKIMLKQQAKAKNRFKLKSFRFSGALLHPALISGNALD